MKILVVGGGGREHAIAKALIKSEVELYAVMKNRNPGIARLCKEFLLIKETETEKIAEWSKLKGIELAVIGPEDPLGYGIVDALQSAGIPSVGPNKAAAQIEISKEFARDLMQKYRVPGTIEYHTFDSVESAKKFLKDYEKEIVVKPIGLTGGKGVKVWGEHLHSKEDVIQYAAEIINNKIGGSSRFLIEEKIVGEEFTLQAFCDGKTVIPMPTVRDHKRAYEGDLGPNTGGMGSFSQEDFLLPYLSKEDFDSAVRIMQATVDAMHSDGSDYKGFLYGGFMLTVDGPKILEYNARLGDPEAMNVLPILDSNFVNICWDIIEGTLNKNKVSFKRLATVCKYAVPKGYGMKPLAGAEIYVNEKSVINSGAELFYAAVNEEQNKIFTTASRSLAVVGIAENVEKAEIIAERGINNVKGEIYIRHDIGKKEAINKGIEHMDALRKAIKNRQIS